MSNTSKYLEENDTSKEKIKNWESSIPMSMKVFSLVIHAKGSIIICYNLRRKQTVESINVTFDEDFVTKDDDEIVPSRKFEGSEGEFV